MNFRQLRSLAGRLGDVPGAYSGVVLDFAPGDPDGFQIRAPADANLAPPGHYMLFVRDANGVPAVAPIIQLVAV